MSNRRRGLVRVRGIAAGRLEETPSGYLFTYDPVYLAGDAAAAVSLTLPLRSEPYVSPHLFPFFEGLLAEGSLRELQSRLHKIDLEDSFGLLLKTAAFDVIGCVTVEPVSGE
jgi:serine/threonine-protein kinase HipA